MRTHDAQQANNIEENKGKKTKETKMKKGECVEQKMFAN